jgi:protein-glutamine gamma-glutamyltransferase
MRAWVGDVVRRLPRLAVVAAAAFAVAASAGQVFGRFTAALLAAPVAPIIAAALAPKRWWARLIVTAAALAVALVTVVALHGGRVPNDAVDAITAGPGQLLSTEWPTPERSYLVGAIGLALAAMSAGAAELARHRRWRALPAAPLAAGAVAVVAASAPAGPQALCAGAVALATVGLLITGHADRMTRRGGTSPARWAPVVVLLAAGAAPLTALSWPDRADPRTPTAEALPLRTTDQLAEVVGQQTVEPPLAIATIRAANGSDSNGVGYYRTAVLTDYDGVLWTNPAPLRPIGGNLAPSADEEVAVEFEITADARALDLLPLPGQPLRIDSPVATDESRSQLRVDPAMAAGSTVTVKVVPFRAFDGAARPNTRQVDDIAAEFETVANRLSGSGTVAERLLELQRVMVAEFELDPDSGGGQRLTLVDQFLTQRQRGTAEQFVAGYVLMARALGVDARVAVGYAVDDPTGDVELTTADARAWVEVRANDGQWLTIDPVPAEPTDTPPEPDAQPQTQAPSAAPAPAPPAPDQGENPSVPNEESDQAGGAIRVSSWWRSAAAGGGLLLAALCAGAGLVVGAKLLRRRRRLRTADARRLVRGAWASATDALVDRGLQLSASATNGQITEAGAEVVGGAAVQLQQLARLDDRARYASFEVTDHGDERRLAVNALRSVERGITSTLPRLGRLRWRLSTRSLRRRWRSPIRS